MPAPIDHRIVTLSNRNLNSLNPLITLLQSTFPEDRITLESFTSKVLLDPNFDSDGAFIAETPDGGPLGFVHAVRQCRPLESAVMTPDRGWITLFAVTEGSRGAGVGSSLLNLAEDWLSSQGCREIWISPYPYGYWTPGVDLSTCSDGITFLEKRGYKPRYQAISMNLNLKNWNTSEKAAQQIEDLEKQGIAFTSYSSEQTVALCEFLKLEFPGDWQRVLRETMLDILAERRNPTSLVLAWDKGSSRCIGFAQHEAERFGPIGVSTQMRGKGIGVSLLTHMLDRMKQNGLESAWFMWTDDRTAGRLYLPAGFQETRRYSILCKTL